MTTPDAPPAGSRFRDVAAVLAVALGAAALTALVFLIRAGGIPGDPAAWPITWQLSSSDHGTLFQFWQDAAAGRPLDWSFSPQEFVFPEIPLSGLSYLIAAGDLYRYYLVTAMLNMAVFALVLTALARVTFPAATLSRSALRAGVALVPLLLLPLVGSSWIMVFHLAATFYVGQFLALLAGPLLFLVRTPLLRTLIAVALALTIASNPLALVFGAPGLIVVAIVQLRRIGWRAMRVDGAWVLGTLALAGIARLLMTPLQGTGLFAYMNADTFRARLGGLWPYWAYQLTDRGTAVVLITGAVLAVGLAVAAAVLAIRSLKLERETGRSRLTFLYLAVIPVGGLAATFVAMIAHPYYFWPVLVLPWVIVLFFLPGRALVVALGVGFAALVGVTFVTGSFGNLRTAGQYFGYQSDETRCMDENVPGEVGFATFSDARRLALPSTTGVRLIPLKSSLEPDYWLANRAPAKLETATFVYLNIGPFDVLDDDIVRAEWGEPDQVLACDVDRSIWIYEDGVRAP